MDDAPTLLSTGFDAPSEEAWMAMVTKTLDGAPFDKRLVSRTYDGLAIQPLYPAAATGATLGRAASFDADRPWDIRVEMTHPDPAQANAAALTDLHGGASSLLLTIDPAGEQGVAVGSEADMARALDGVFLDLAPVALEAGYLGPKAADWLVAHARKQTLKPRLALNLDPLSTFATSGMSPGPIESHIIAAAQIAARLEVERAFLATGRVVHEAGGSDAQALGFMLASAVAYLKAAVRAGMGMEAALSAISLGVVCDGEYFTGIALARSARSLWARLASTLTVAPAPTFIEARTSRRMLSTLDPWVNMLRLTAAGFGAGVGGADAILIDPFTLPLGRSTAFSRRQARNAQLVLMEEAHIGKVDDPGAGSGLIEAMTLDLARAGWAVFQAIEARGGVVAALTSGWMAAEVASVRERRTKDIATRRRGLIGVSEFPDLHSRAVEVEAVDPAPFGKSNVSAAMPGPDGHCPPLTPWRASADFEALRARASHTAPTVFLATLGSPKDYTARLAFARNLFASGGFETPAGAVEAYDAAHAALAVICSSDAVYADDAEEAARTLKAKGARSVWLAGRPGELEAMLKAAGVDEFLFGGGDAIATLSHALDTAA